MPTQYSTVEWLDKLVRHQTTFDQSNLPLIEEIEGYLGQWGVACQKSFDDEGRKANLLATIGDPGRPGTILSGHTDVVPVDGQRWQHEPFRLTLADGRAFGRGACDMKGFLSVVLAMVPELVAASDWRTTHLAFSYDEEIGCVGARRLMPMVARLDALPDACIVGEPTSMRIFVGHKGKTSYRVRVRGCECHSSMPMNGVNAVEIAAELVTLLSREARQRRDLQTRTPFDPPYTTVHTGVIRGGTALNIVPNECNFDFELRNLPGEDTDDVIKKLAALSKSLLDERARGFAQAGVEVDVKASYPGLSTPEDHPVVQRAEKALGTTSRHYASFGSEAGLFSSVGVPTIVLGPGSIDQAHKADEFVAINQLQLCEKTLRDLLIERSQQRAGAR